MDDDIATLTALNAKFIGAWQVGSLEDLDAVLDTEFVVLDGITGEVTDRAAYRAGMAGPNPTLAVDQVVVHVTGDTAVVSGRTTRDGASYRRYVDVYRRGPDGWTCVFGCPWSI